MYESEKSAIDAIADCDKFIAEAQQDRARLVYKLDGLNLRNGESSNSFEDAEQELTEAQNRHNSLTTEVAGMPEGDSKKTKLIHLAQAYHELLVAQSRVDNYGPLSAFERRHQIRNTELLLAEKDLAITAMQERRAEIVAAG